MCGTCDCSTGAVITIAGAPDSHHGGEVIDLEHRVLAKNDRLADQNRTWLARLDVAAVNVLSGPGAGKTTLLSETLAFLPADRPVYVIDGDQATSLDADRLAARGHAVVQINTGAGCHLDAAMIHSALHHLDPLPGALLLIENVGNLVCPAMFDLGERAKVVLLSVTEGEDKPYKYPHVFRAADLVLITKTDLLPHVPFDLPRALEAVRTVSPRADILEVSAITGAGLGAWLAWLRRLRNTRPGLASLMADAEASA